MFVLDPRTVRTNCFQLWISFLFGNYSNQIYIPDQWKKKKDQLEEESPFIICRHTFLNHTHRHTEYKQTHIRSAKCLHRMYLRENQCLLVFRLFIAILSKKPLFSCITIECWHPSTYFVCFSFSTLAISVFFPSCHFGVFVFFFKVGSSLSLFWSPDVHVRKTAYGTD